MSQFGMQMPGGQKARKASPDVYTVLMFVACAALAGATAMVALNGILVGKDGSPIALQEEGRVELGDR